MLFGKEKEMVNIIEIHDFSAPELDIYARWTENQLLNRKDPANAMLCAQLRVCSQAGGIPVYPRFSQPDNSESWDDAGNGI